MTWEDGDNLLGEDGYFFLERQTGTYGCIDGIKDSEVAACQSEWRLFNIGGSSEYGLFRAFSSDM